MPRMTPPPAAGNHPFRAKIGSQSVDVSALADLYLGNQDHGRRLQEIVDLTTRYRKGFWSPAEGSFRLDTRATARRHAIQLRNILGRLDLWTLTQAMGMTRVSGPRPGPGPMGGHDGRSAPHPASLPESSPSILPLRLEELSLLSNLLDRLITGLAAVQDPLPPRGKPTLPDPLRLAVDLLAGLWEDARGETPNGSMKRHSFHDFALTVLGPGGLAFEAASVRTAVRQHVAAQRQSAVP